MARLCQEPLRNQWTAAAAGTYNPRLAASAFQDFQSRSADFRIVMIRERIVEQCRSGARSPVNMVLRQPLFEGLPLPGRQSAPAIDTHQLLVQPPDRRAGRDPVRKRRETAAPNREPMNIPE